MTYKNLTIMNKILNINYNKINSKFNHNYYIKTRLIKNFKLNNLNITIQNIKPIRINIFNIYKKNMKNKIKIINNKENLMENLILI